MTDQKLTETQLEFLETYASLQKELGRGPSIREMAAAWGRGYSDHSGAQHMLYKLRDMGLVKLQELIPGGLTPDGTKELQRAKRRKLRSAK